jgi:hypothetical protein
VRDSAALLDATAGPEIGDPYWAPPPKRAFQADDGEMLKRSSRRFVRWRGKPKRSFNSSVSGRNIVRTQRRQLELDEYLMTGTYFFRLLTPSIPSP